MCVRLLGSIDVCDRCNGRLPAMSPLNDGVSVRIDDGRDVSDGRDGKARDAQGRDETGNVCPSVDLSGANTISLTLTAFDTRHYLELIRARGATIRRVIAALKPAMGLRSALDAGCGI